MRILLSLLLIPFVVLGQALPHSHAGSGVVEPSDHAARPHVHLFGGHSHHQEHTDCDHQHADEATETAGAASGFSVPPAHDSDAIYLAQASTTIARATTTSPVNFTSVASFVDHEAHQPMGFSAPSDGTAYRRYDGLSIYLLVNSFRL